MTKLLDRPRGRPNDLYCALDPIWRSNSVASEGLIPLREHMKRLSSIIDKLSESLVSDHLDSVSEPLRVGASLNNLSVDTDIDGTGLWCRSASDFEAANSEVVAKHIAGIIVFQLVWIAYESAIEMASQSSERDKYRGKGALGREVIFRLMKNRCFPRLRQVLSGALELYAADMEYFRTRLMRQLIDAGSIAAIGAEHLRCFRNAVIHGEIRSANAGRLGRMFRLQRG